MTDRRRQARYCRPFSDYTWTLSVKNGFDDEQRQLVLRKYAYPYTLSAAISYRYHERLMFSLPEDGMQRSYIEPSADVCRSFV